MNGTDISIDERIRAFAASVRRHLDDLPDEELDDILSGLTADLTEQADDHDGVLELGDPAAYADELRSAAGLPPRGAARSRRPFREGLLAWRRDLTAGIRRSAFGSWLLDFLVALRPVWWVLRAYGIFVILLGGLLFGRGRDDGGMLPGSLLEWLVLLALVVVSVQWGRGRWLPKNPLRYLRSIASAAAIIALPFAFGSLVSPRVEYVYDEQQGLRLDGVQIGNLFAFDAEGEPIEHVQLFTDKGTPVELYGDDSSDMEYGWHDDGETIVMPFRDYRDQPVWNVYPLDQGRIDHQTGEPRSSSIRQPEPPFRRAPGLASTAPTPTPTPTPTDAAPDPESSPEP